MAVLPVFKLNTNNRIFSDGNLDNLSQATNNIVIFTLMIFILFPRNSLEQPDLIYVGSVSFVLLEMTLVTMLDYIIGKPHRA